MAKQQHLRGNNPISNKLNKPITGTLGKKRSKRFVFVFGIIAAIGLWWYTSSLLGFKAGAVITLITVGFLIFNYCEHKWHLKKRKGTFIKKSK